MMAGVEVGIDNAVALRQGLPGRIHFDVAAKAFHPPGHLVAHDRYGLARRIPMPAVQVRAADAADSDPDQNAVRLDLRNGKLPRLERLVGACVDIGPALHRVFLPKCTMS